MGFDGLSDRGDEFGEPVAIEVPESFREQPRWWRDGTDWLNALPVLVAEQCARWALTVDGPPRHGANALVVPVRRGGELLALRLSPPGDEVSTEAAALRFWAGRGTVLLVDVDHDHRAQLLERLDADRSLIDWPLLEAVEILGRLARRLAVPVPDAMIKVSPSTSAVVAADLAEFSSHNERLGRPLPDRLLASAIEAGHAVIDTATAVLAVNADLHFEQVLAGTREPWLVVDPVLMHGDLAYDFGRVLWYRLDEVPDEVGIVDLLRRLAEAAEVPTEHARRWVVYRAASYLFWGLEHGLTIDPPRCRRLLDALSQIRFDAANG